jgi:hypothetical protein
MGRGGEGKRREPLKISCRFNPSLDSGGTGGAKELGIGMGRTTATFRRGSVVEALFFFVPRSSYEWSAWMKCL